VRVGIKAMPVERLAGEFRPGTAGATGAEIMKVTLTDCGVLSAPVADILMVSE